jgi:transcriptional regulator with XRE-family HTH domain
MQKTNLPASVNALLARIGEQLKFTREELGLSREDVCRSLKMHINSVIALEEGLFDDLPGAAYFFAALRSYSRLLKLDTEKLIQECKKNKFLFEALQGEGLIQRGSKEEEDITNNVKKYSPVTLPKLDVNRDAPRDIIGLEDDEALQEKLDRKKETSKPAKKSNAFSALIIGLGIFIACVGVLIANPSFTNLPEDNAITQRLYGLRSLFAKPGSCKPFKLIAKDNVEVKITALSIGQTILERSLAPGEEVNFSDSYGVQIELADPSLVELSHNSQPLDMQKLDKGNGIFVFKCS